MGVLKDFRWSFGFALVAIVLAYIWAGVPAAIAAMILMVLEVSISFDNAVVNAKVLKDMDPVWQKRFLTWGMVIAVFGMRVVFPVAIVAIAGGLGMFEVAKMALNDPDQYASHLHDAHYIISAFGGVFLLMVFLEFMLDHEREEQWVKPIERLFAKIGKLESFSIAIALTVLMVSASYVPEKEQFSVVMSGLIGLVTFIVLGSLSAYMEEMNEEKDESEKLLNPNLKKAIISAGFITFMYLEVLDASLSLDGVIGAFAITKDVVVIMLGLGVGALFVRSMTISLVKRGTLAQFIYLDHGAHYAIGSLATIMFLSMFVHVTEVITGLIGAAFISAGIYTSIQHNKKISAQESVSNK